MATDDAAAKPLAPDLRALIAGPPPYRPVAAWGPVQALVITAIACLAPLALAMVGISLAAVAGTPQATLEYLAATMSSLSSPAGAAVLASSQLLSLLIIWIAAGRGGLRAETLRLADPKPAWSTALVAGLLLITVTGAVELVLYGLLGFDLFADTKWLMEGLNSSSGWAVAFGVIVLAPAWEELTFRGFLLSALAKSRLGFWPAALISTGLWTLLHASYSYAGLMSIFAAGLMLSWLMLRLGSMRMVIVAHAIANIVALSVAYFFAPVG